MSGRDLVDDTELRRVLEEARVVAVLGAHDEPSRPACYVPEYLAQVGYRVLPVNPALAGRPLFGAVVAARLDELAEAVDVVDVFRRADALAAHVPEILSMRPLPRVVWLQLGIRNDDFARAIRAAGIDVVQDACTLADHRRFGLGRRI
jgi:predicted CoA-binding protein